MRIQRREDRRVDGRDDVYVVARRYVSGDTLELARGQGHGDVTPWNWQEWVGAALDLVGIGGNDVGRDCLAFVYRHHGGVATHVLQSVKGQVCTRPPRHPA